ncbi:hypothetical protein NONI108955_00340 [Nocardia ninae]
MPQLTVHYLSTFVTEQHLDDWHTKRPPGALGTGRSCRTDLPENHPILADISGIIR